MEQIYRSYYTKSNPIVSYMINMLSAEPGMRVFEPCAGDGVFIDALIRRVHGLVLEAYELNPQAPALHKYGGVENIRVTYGDTLTSDALLFATMAGGIYDRIIANPPYGAWQDYDLRKSLKRLYPDLYTKETYTMFLFRCIQLLRDNGILVFIIPDTFLFLHMHTILREFILTNTRIKEILIIPPSFFPGVNFGYSNLSVITLQRSSDREACLSHQFRIRTGFKDVNDLDGIWTSNLKTYTFAQRSIYENPEHAFFIADDRVLASLINCPQTVGDIAHCVTGFYSGDDKTRLRITPKGIKKSTKYKPLDADLICEDWRTRADLLNGVAGSKRYIPIVKGGGVKYWKPDTWYMDWGVEAVRLYKEDSRSRFQNSRYYFQYGIGIPMVSSTQITAAMIENRLFDQSIVGVFPQDPALLFYLLAFFNSPTCNRIIRIINPSANNSANYIKKVPFVYPSERIRGRVTDLVMKIIDELRAGRSYEQDWECEINAIIADSYGF